jgi:hypothetical protein
MALLHRRPLWCLWMTRTTPWGCRRPSEPTSDPSSARGLGGSDDSEGEDSLGDSKEEEDSSDFEEDDGGSSDEDDNNSGTGGGDDDTGGDRGGGDGGNTGGEAPPT